MKWSPSLTGFNSRQWAPLKPFHAQKGNYGCVVFSHQRLKFEIAEVMTEIEQLTCVGDR